MANLTSTIKLSLDSSSVKRGVEDMKSQFKKLGKAMKAAVTVGAVATFAYFNKFRQEMDRIGKVSKRLEVAPEILQRIGLAAELAGTDTEGLVKGMQTLNKALVKAEQGSKGYQEALALLGLSASALLGLGMEDQLVRLAEGYSNSNRGAREQAAIMELMGRNGAELIPLLRAGPDALREAMERARPVSAATIADMEKLNDEMTKMSQDIQFAFSKVLSWLHKAVQTVADYITTRFAVILKQLEAVGKFLTGDLVGAARAVDVAGEISREGSQAREDIWKDAPTTPRQNIATERFREAQNTYQERGGWQGDKSGKMLQELIRLRTAMERSNQSAFSPP